MPKVLSSRIMREMYNTGGTTVTDTDIAKALETIDVQKGDTIFVHSDIATFGKLALPDKDLFLSRLVEVLRNSAGAKGTLVMPTFSYSFCRSEEFDRAKTPSTVGSLSEFFRVQKGVVRNGHPIFSVAALGPHAKDFLATSKDSLGAGTIFETLRTLDAKFVFFGTSFSRSCTFIHHIEQMAQVPYRFMKTFSGEIVEGKKRHHDSYTYYVRKLDGSGDADFVHFEKLLLKKNILREVPVGRGYIQGIGARALYEQGMGLLNADPNAFIKRYAD